LGFKPVPTQKKIEAVSRVVAGKMSATGSKKSWGLYLEGKGTFGIGRGIRAS